MPNGSKQWLLDYFKPYTKKRTSFSLGSYPDVSLANARAKRVSSKELLAKDIDPKEYKDDQHREQLLLASQTYSDRDINLLKLLIQYIKSEAGCDQSNLIIGLSSFHFCWEYMLGQVLKYTVSLNNKLPVPAYIDTNGNVLTANEKSMRTDIILHDEGNQQCTVADAKYYAATTVANAPGWGDIVKQLFYEKALSKLDINWKIKNAFIFPGCEPYLAKAQIRDRVNSTQSKHVFIDEFEPIHCYYANPMEVVSKFITGNKMSELTEQLITNNEVI
jgi:hypothetical protein